MYGREKKTTGYTLIKNGGLIRSSTDKKKKEIALTGMEANSKSRMLLMMFFLGSVLLEEGSCFTVSVNVSAGGDSGGGSGGEEEEGGGGGGEFKNNIEKACNLAPHHEICEASLATDPNSGTADMEGLALIALKVALANATETSQHINKILKNSTLDPFIEQCLSDCVEQYWDAMDQIEDSLAAIGAREFADVNDWVKAAIADADTCEQGFKEKSGYESMLTSRNDIFKRLCLNAISIASQLH